MACFISLKKIISFKLIGEYLSILSRLAARSATERNERTIKGEEEEEEEKRCLLAIFLLCPTPSIETITKTNDQNDRQTFSKALINSFVFVWQI